MSPLPQSSIPVQNARKSTLFVPCSLEFTSIEHGVLILEGTIVEHESSIFTTSNGGVSWVFSHGRSGITHDINRLVVTKGGSLWKLEDNRILVSSDTGLNWRKTEGRPVLGVVKK